MNLKSKLLTIIPSVTMAGLVFVALISYQSIITFTVVKQHELLKSDALQILSTRPDSKDAKDWVTWLNSNHHARSSGYMIILQKNTGEIIATLNGTQSLANETFARHLSSRIDRENFPDQYIVDQDLRYIWKTTPVENTPYSLQIIYASSPEGLAFYFKYLGVPILIAALILLWVSFWLSIILANLYRKLDDQKNQMQHNALHDPLTGLPNRLLFNDRLKHTLDAAKRDNSYFAICMIDLDRFKEINDALGHEYGDKLLIEVASRMKNILREVDTIARLGGDEFIILLHNTRRQRAEKIARRISDSLKQEFQFNNERFHISGSIGVSLYPEHGMQAELLIKSADMTMYHAKKCNYDFSIYNPENDNFHKNSLFLFTDLVEAINKHDFEIFYQPKIDVKENRIIGVEALLRWQHPSQGFVKPGVFIPIAEQTGLIRNITRWEIEKVMQDQYRLKQQGIHINIAINLSVHDLDDENIFNYIMPLTEQYAIEPSELTLEITESAMMFNPAVTDRILTRLSNEGFAVSIDDFGTGYSSLSNLQRLDVKEIKIDRSFIRDMDINENNSRIVRGTIGLAHDLGMKVVAEGVETEKCIELLTRLDCDLFQGFGICKPVPLDQLISIYWPENTAINKQS